MTRFLIGLACLVLLGCGGELPKPNPLPSGAAYEGVWDTNWGQMELHQEGRHVHGTYKGFRNGSVSGDTNGDLFVFRWTQVESRQWGRGYLQMSPDGAKLEGNWGYRKNYHDGGRWWATRAN